MISAVESFFWITMGGIIVGVVTLCLKFGYKSKCVDVNLCYGLIKYTRNTEEEFKEDMAHPEKTTQEIV
jgi:hypothetical protein